MALVTVTGTLLNPDRSAVPAGVQPELVFRPNKATSTRAMRTNWEVPAKTYDVATGQFTVDLESIPEVRYTPVLRWLVSQGDFERKAFGYCEWPEFFPDIGGDIRDLWELVYGVGLVLVSSSVPTGRPIARYQIQYNPQTYDLYERKISWPNP